MGGYGDEVSEEGVGVPVGVPYVEEGDGCAPAEGGDASGEVEDVCLVLEEDDVGG